MHEQPTPSPLALARTALQWLLLASLVGVLAGSASALFLWALDAVTQVRESHRWLVWGLPVAGLAMAWVYLHFGDRSEAGNNLLIDEIHDPRQVVPLRMAPLILVSTVVSHLFGASVGREGTAVQMGGALADQISRLLPANRDHRRTLLMAGIAAGFASVFGTPLAGTVFALEVLAIGRLRYDALWACAVAAVVGDQTTLLWGIHHTRYALDMLPVLNAWTLCAAALAGIAFGLAGRGFAWGAHTFGHWMKATIPNALWRPVVGGTVLAAALWWLDAWRYAGLGVPVIVEAFAHPVPAQDWLGKMLFTIASLGSGFKGGEVTPLFYIGATLGNALAPWLQVPFAWLAALGFVGVFAGAANTPLACTLMAMELFGPGMGVPALLACVVSYLVSGHSGIYKAQKVVQRKH